MQPDKQVTRLLKCHSCKMVSIVPKGFECPQCGSLVTEVAEPWETPTLRPKKGKQVSKQPDAPQPCRECGETEYHAPYCKVNLDRCGTQSITMQTVLDSERVEPDVSRQPRVESKPMMHGDTRWCVTHNEPMLTCERGHVVEPPVSARTKRIREMQRSAGGKEVTAIMVSHGEAVSQPSNAAQEDIEAEHEG